MLLRRITQHINSQNWFAVLVDFLIVVVGVFIGIQVSNWNEDRSDRADEQRFLQDLRADLATDYEDLKNISASATARVMAVNYILKEAIDETPPEALDIPTGTYSNIMQTNIRLPAGMPEDPDVISPPWAVINFVKVGFSKRGSYAALVNSGDIRLIRDHQLAHKLHTYYNMYTGLEQTQQNRFLYTWNSYSTIGRDHGLSSFDNSPAERIIAIARQSDEFVVALREAREIATLHFNIVLGLEQRAEELLMLIDEETP